MTPPALTMQADPGDAPVRRLDPEKFRNPDVTKAGTPRAAVALKSLDTLWFNTGTLCNIACAHCYIESSPTNDRLVYLTAAEIAGYLDEITERGLPTRQIGFTGGEPFMNPDILAMLADALKRGFSVLVLTNAMQPMMRPRIRHGLSQLADAYRDRLCIRVSLDHYASAIHDQERGTGSFACAIEGLKWLSDHGLGLAVAGRYFTTEDENAVRAGFANLFAAEGLAVDATDMSALVLFPEMDDTVDVPEITDACWQRLGKDPASVMCASSRMVLKRKAANHPAVVACTLLAYDRGFELGRSLAEACGSPVKLNHPHCARFCVLGGASCSA